jgi:replicative DNA helicase
LTISDLLPAGEMPADERARQPPRDLEAEAAVLGAMLLDPGALERALVTLQATDFYNPTHRLIFDACAALEAAGRPVDAVTVASQLAATGTLEETGGSTYLHVLITSVPTVSQAITYIDLVAATATTRRLIDAGHRIAQLGHEGLDPDKAHQLAVDLLAQVANDRARAGNGDPRLQRGDTAILDAPADIEALWGGDGEVAWAAGEALIIVGPQGVGKSTLAQRLALARIGIGPPELLEMPVAPGRRVLYLACDRPRQILRSMRRMVTDDDRAVLAERLQVWRGPPPEDVAKHPRLLLQLARKADADTVVVDSLKDVALAISTDEGGSAYNRARQTALVEGIEVIEIHHQRKAQADNRKPRKLADVYGSIFVTAGAGSVILLWGDPGDLIVEFSHLKQPVDMIGDMKLEHDPDSGRVSVYQGADLLGMVRSQPGLTAADAARLLFGIVGRGPEPRELKQASRRLDKLAAKGLIHVRQGSRGGPGGSTPATYHPLSLVTEEP